MRRLTRTIPMLARVLFACLLMFGVARAEQSVLEVIPLKHRPADQVIPVLRSLVAPSGTVTGMNNQVIIRTTPANMKELKEVLAKLDTRPRRLLISVRQDADVNSSAGGVGVSGRVEIGDEVVVSSRGGSKAPRASVRVDGARAKVYSSEGQRASRISQQVQVVEGGEALIRIGESVPVVARDWVDTPTGPRVVETNVYRDVDRGFLVVPRVVGDQVTLELSAAADPLRSRRNGATDLQRVRTTLSGRLGEWIEVAGIGEDAIEHDSGILASSRDARREARRVLLKVDEIK
ncbi:MAG TPA: secretin N-terminal domain-containing protein [Burkholderiales bacterium]|nr:secretin N-terminal domain-containing protein [Burkholderiales bacterium]